MTNPNPNKSLTASADALCDAVVALRSGCAKSERHIHTLLGFLEGIRLNHPEVLSETALFVCRGIARDVGAPQFAEPKK